MKLLKQMNLVFLLCISICLTFQTNAFAVPKAVKAKSEYMLAERMYNEGKFQDCIKRAAIVKDILGKSNSRIEYLLTKAYYKNNQLEKAMTSVDLFFELTPESASGTKQYNEMVEVYSKIEFEKAQQEKKNAPKYYEQGEKLQFSNQKQALIFFNKAINADPEYVNAYIKRSWLYQFGKGGVKKYDKAIQDYNKLIELMPNSSRFYSYLAGIYARCPDKSYRNGPKAIELAQKAVSIQRSSDNLSTLASAYKENKQYDKAIEVQKEAERQRILAEKKEKERHRKKMLAKCPDMHKNRIKWLKMLIKNADDWNARTNRYGYSKETQKHVKELRELRESISNCKKKYSSTQN